MANFVKLNSQFELSKIFFFKLLFWCFVIYLGVVFHCLPVNTQCTAVRTQPQTLCRHTRRWWSSAVWTGNFLGRFFFLLEGGGQRVFVLSTKGNLLVLMGWMTQKFCGIVNKNSIESFHLCEKHQWSSCFRMAI